MTINLIEDLQRIRTTLLERIANFHLDTSPAPLGTGDTIQQVVIGYEFEQSGWVCMVFDMRPDASLDGEWTHAIEETKLDFKQWGEAFWNGDTESFEIVFPDGQLKSSDDIECEDFSIALGESLRALLLETKNSGAFDTLPISSTCTFAIEDFNGYFGWVSDEDDDDEDDEEVA